MAKRFFEPEWKVLRKLKSNLREAWFYCWDKADAVGVYEYDAGYMAADLGFTVELEELLKLPNVVKISAEKILFTDFIIVNYGKLKPEYNPHKPAFRALAKNNLKLNSTLTQACAKLEDEEEGKEEGKGVKGKKGAGKKPDEPPIEIMMPWQTDRFKVQWGLWKKHRSETDGHKYKPIGEQAALSELAKLSNGNEETGIAIIHQSMANSWKGFFELKQNGKQITGTGSGKFNRDDMEAGLAEVLRQQQRNSANSH